MFPAHAWAGSGRPAPEGADDGGALRRPPNAFILYSQAMRPSCRVENPSMSNTEVTRLLGQMWKDAPPDITAHYKQKAAAAQEQFKHEHPNYGYRKARTKRALDELFAKNAQGLAPDAGFPGGMAAGGGQCLMQRYAQGQMMQQQALGGVAMGGFPGQAHPFGAFQGQPAAFQYPPK
jgi:hypothetical protein